jgi:hypothetical protein
MYGNGKRRPVEITSGKEGGRIKKNGEGCEFNYDTL